MGRRVRAALLGATGTALLVLPLHALGSEVEPPRPEAPPAAVPPGGGGSGLGRDLYVRSCASCHGTNGEGTPRGPSVVDVGAASAYFQLTTGRMPPSDLDEIPSRSEPAFDEDEIDALVDYIGSLGDGPPVPDVGPGELDEGLLLYVENCAACHSATGVGAAKVTRLRSPSLMSSTPRQIASAIRVGPNLMPHYPEEVLDEQDVDDLVAYVQHLQTTGNRGGLALGRIGPTTETVAGWLALGLLLVVVRRLGKPS